MKSAESGKLSLKFVGFAKFTAPPSELNSTAISENLPLFWNRLLQVFFFSIFGLEFAETGKIWRIRQITAEICRICQIFRATLRIKLICNFYKFAIKAFLNNDIR